MAGKLIVLEGVDGTGKSTQFALLCDALRRRGVTFRELSFPDYADDSSALVRMYLGGEFGGDPDAVSPYAASVFYACDRYASFKRRWQEDWEAGGLCVSCRYTTSNAVHQGAKLAGDERRAYWEWLFDFEYRLLGIPAPDRVILLDLPAQVALANVRERGEKGDIHEGDADFLARSAEAAREAAQRYGWTVVPCAEGGVMRSREAIHEDLVRATGE